MLRWKSKNDCKSDNPATLGSETIFSSKVWCNLEERNWVYCLQSTQEKQWILGKRKRGWKLEILWKKNNLNGVWFILSRWKIKCTDNISASLATVWKKKNIQIVEEVFITFRKTKLNSFTVGWKQLQSYKKNKSSTMSFSKFICQLLFILKGKIRALFSYLIKLCCIEC